MSYYVDTLQEVGPPPDAAEMIRRLCEDGQCRAEMRREDFTDVRYVITSLSAMTAGNHMVLFNVNAQRNIAPPTTVEIFVEGGDVHHHLGHVMNVPVLRDEGGGLDLLGEVEGLLTGAVADAPELRVVRLRLLAEGADSVECPACSESKTVILEKANGVFDQLNCPACHRRGRLSAANDTLPR